MDFIDALTAMYMRGRFGEETFSENTREAVQRLDALAKNLLEIYSKAISYPSRPKLYVADSIREAFLSNNAEFGESDITNDVLAKVSAQF